MKMDFSKELTNFELIEYARLLGIPLLNVLMKDEVYKGMPNGFYILNLENHNQAGSHWVALIKRKKEIFYFDSYGMPPPDTVINKLQYPESHVFFNDTQIQNIKSILCGYYCLLFLFHMKATSSLANNIMKFLQLFYLNTKKNDELLKKYLTQLLL